MSLKWLRTSVIIILFISGCKKNPDASQNKQKPTAEFSFTILADGLLPAKVNFSNQSKNAEAYQWIFGDGNTSSSANPENTYNQAKSYQVKLIARNSNGTDSVTKTIRINQNKPKADFSFSVINDGQIPSTVKFSNTSIGASTYKWYFGDQKTSNEANPEHQYLQNKTFKVQLVVTNAAGTDSISKELLVSPIINSVLVYLITPKDRSFNQKYYDALKASVIKTQTWYKQQLGKTFVLNPIIIDTLKGTQEYSWYNSNNGPFSGTDPRFYGYQNTYKEMQDLMGDKFNTTKYTYFVYVAAPGGGAGTKGFCAMGDQDLLGLIGKNPENLNPLRWIGGGAHELGHSFGLPHPDNQNPKALMWTGYTTFPDCILQQADKDILNSSPFFK